MTPITVITITYLDKFGVKKQYITSAHLNKKDQGQSTDPIVKDTMRKLGIKKCWINYRDYEFRHAGKYPHEHKVPYRLQPDRPRRRLSI